MAFDAFNSESLTRLTETTQSGPVTASQGVAVGSSQQGRRNVVQTPGSTYVGDSARVGNVDLRQGANSNVTITTSDGGAIQTAAGILRDVVTSQANLALGAVGLAQDSQARLSDIAETKVSDGSNLTQGTTQVGILSVAIAAVLIALFFFLKRK